MGVGRSSPDPPDLRYSAPCMVISFIIAGRGDIERLPFRRGCEQCPGFNQWPPNVGVPSSQEPVRPHSPHHAHARTPVLRRVYARLLPACTVVRVRGFATVCREGGCVYRRSQGIRSIRRLCPIRGGSVGCRVSRVAFSGTSCQEPLLSAGASAVCQAMAGRTISGHSSGAVSTHSSCFESTSLELTA